METYKFFKSEKHNNTNRSNNCVKINFADGIGENNYIVIDSIMYEITDENRQKCIDMFGNGSKLLQFAMYQYYLYIEQRDNINKDEVAFYLVDSASIKLTETLQKYAFLQLH